MKEKERRQGGGTASTRKKKREGRKKKRNNQHERIKINWGKGDREHHYQHSRRGNKKERRQTDRRESKYEGRKRRRKGGTAEEERREGGRGGERTLDHDCGTWPCCWIHSANSSHFSLCTYKGVWHRPWQDSLCSIYINYSLYIKKIPYHFYNLYIFSIFCADFVYHNNSYHCVPGEPLYIVSTFSPPFHCTFYCSFYVHIHISNVFFIVNWWVTAKISQLPLVVIVSFNCHYFLNIFYCKHSKCTLEKKLWLLLTSHFYRHYNSCWKGWKLFTE